MSEVDNGFCCAMREHFLIGIVAEKHNTAAPIDVADFMVSFDPPVIAIKFCPFCGKNVNTKTDNFRIGRKI